MQEEWKDIPSYKGYYQASNFGNVRSVDREIKKRNGKKEYRKGVFLKPNMDDIGRLGVCININGKKNTKGIGVLVAEAFFGTRPQGMFVCHNNGNPADNRLENLRYDTPSGNINDMRKHGTFLEGETSPRAKLTDEQVLQIRDYAEKHIYSLAELARMYKLGETTVRHIVHNTRWKHLRHCNYKRRLYKKLSDTEYIELMKIIGSGLYMLSTIARVYGLSCNDIYHLNRRRVRGLQYV